MRCHSVTAGSDLARRKGQPLFKTWAPNAWAHSTLGSGTCVLDRLLHRARSHTRGPYTRVVLGMLITSSAHSACQRPIAVRRTHVANARLTRPKWATISPHDCSKLVSQ